MTTLQRVVLAASLLGLLSSMACSSQSAISPWLDGTIWGDHQQHEYDRFAEMLWQLAEPVEQALLIVGWPVYVMWSTDYETDAQLVLNLLEGTGGAHYRAIEGQILGLEQGIQPVVEAFEFEDEKPGAPSTSADYLDGLRLNLERLRARLRVAADAALGILDESVSDSERTDAFVIAEAVLGEVQETITWVTKYRGFQVWVSPGESVQAAIDSAREGATVFLEAGIFRESIEITKSITLAGRGWHGDAQARQSTGSDDTVLISQIEPVAQQIGVSVHSEEPIDVAIRDLTLSRASTALRASGQASLTVENVIVEDCATVVELSGSAEAELTELYPDYQCGVLLMLSDAAACTVSGCMFAGMRDELAGVQVRGTASLSILDSEIDGNQGVGILMTDESTVDISDSSISLHGSSGIVLAGTASLDLLNCHLFSNGGPAVHAISAECPLDGSEDLEVFTGMIRGSGNQIITRKSAGGVLALCPGSLDFLTEPTPTEVTVAPGESIQEGIDRVAKGGTVYILAGTYAESIVVSKSVSLVATSHAPNGESQIEETELVGEPWRGQVPFSATVEIKSVVPIDVFMHGIVIESSGGAISIEGESNVSLQGVTIRGNERGLVVLDGGQASASQCRFVDNDTSVEVSRGGTGTLQDCVVEGNSDKGYAIVVLCGRIEILDSEIRDNGSGGVFASGGSVTELHMVGNLVVRNSIGVRVHKSACELSSAQAESRIGNPMSDYDFPTISGWANVIPSSNETDGNILGAFDVRAHLDSLDISFLLEPEPENE